MIDDPHTTLIMLQLYVPIMQMANHLHGYQKPNRLGVEHLVANAQLYKKGQKRFEDTKGKNQCSTADTLHVSPCTQLNVPA